MKSSSRCARFASVLKPNKVQPIAFDIFFDGELPPFFEKRNRRRVAHRVSMDLIRYHQPGKVSGWVEIDGKREAVDENWFGFRDHSWGTRASGVGARMPDLMPNQGLGNVRLLWGPWLFERPDGYKYELMHFWTAGPAWTYFSSHMNEAGAGPDEVRQTEIKEMVPNVKFDPKTRRFLGGTYDLLLSTGETKTIEVTPVGNTAFPSCAPENTAAGRASGTGRGKAIITRMANISLMWSRHCHSSVSSAMRR